MRSLILAAITAAATAGLVLPAMAATQHSRPFAQEPQVGAGGPGNGPYWSGEPGDRGQIWRYGYYQGNDPDRQVREGLMRDPTNHF